MTSTRKLYLSSGDRFNLDELAASAEFQLNASERIKVNSYGEATILYKGKAQLKKGIVIGESTIRKLL